MQIGRINQYTAIAGAMACSPTFDFDGNMTWDGKNVNSWDGENRLIRSEPVGLATNGAVLVENSYDYQNRRFKKTVKQLSGRGAGYPMDPSQPGTWNVIETRKYIWDNWNIAAEIVISDSAGTTNINYNTWGLDLSGSLQGAGGVGGLLVVTKASSSTTNAYFAAADANGNVTAYVDVSGTAVAHYWYSAFGETTEKSGSMADDFTHRFSTKLFDVETGLVMYQLRAYSPALGRWISLDPIEEAGGLNLYAVLANCCLNYTDTLGQGKTVQYSKRFWAYLEWFPDQATGEIKILDNGMEVMRFRYNAATGEMVQILEHGGKPLQGISASAMKKIAPAIQLSLKEIVKRVGGNWVLTSISTPATSSGSKIITKGRYLGGIVLSAILFALEPTAIGAEGPLYDFRSIGISEDVEKILVEEGVVPQIETSPKVSAIDAVKKDAGSHDPCKIGLKAKASLIP